MTRSLVLIALALGCSAADPDITAERQQETGQSSAAYCSQSQIGPQQCGILRVTPSAQYSCSGQCDATVRTVTGCAVVEMSPGATTIGHIVIAPSPGVPCYALQDQITFGARGSCSCP